MKIPALSAAPLALLACALPVSAQPSAHSSPEDRRRVVSIAHQLERAPLDASLHNDRAWAMQWVIDAPDLTVNACLDPLGGISQKQYPHSGEIIAQYSLAMAAFIIENPAKENDEDAQQLAGVESALNAYRAMRSARPDDKSPALEKLLALQSGGELPGFVHKAYLRCLAKEGKE